MEILFGGVSAWVVAVWVHELGHYLAARKFGCPPDFIQIGAPAVLSLRIAGVLHKFGPFLLVGFVKEASCPVRLRERACVALAGPLFNLALGLPCLFLARASGSLWLSAFTVFNLLGVVCNLIPVPPSDGWRIAELTAWSKGQRLSRGFGIFAALLFYGGMALLVVAG